MPEFGFTEAHEMLRIEARRFAQKELSPGFKERARSNRIPEELFKKVGEAGYIGAAFDTKYGGQGLDMMSVGIIVEEFAKVDITSAHLVSVPTEFNFLLKAGGNEEQCQKWLPMACKGELIPSIALTEPSCGTDAAAMETRAVKSDECYILNGEKTPVSRGMQAHLFAVWAKTDPEAGVRGVSCFLVPAGTSGLSRSEVPYMGLIPLNCASIFLDSVRVPESNRVGEEGKGFYLVMGRFDTLRVGLCLTALGQAEVSLDEVAEYTKSRTAFGKPIAKYEAISFKIAEAATRIEAARLLCYRTLWMEDQGLKHSKETAMCKWFAPFVATQVVHDCILMMGHYGFSTEYPLAQRLCDTMSYEMADGSAEAQKLVIVREMLGREFLPYR